MKHNRIVNLDTMEWEPWHPQFEGTFAKTLYIDNNTGANLRMAFLPAGFKLNQTKRHHHGETREGVFVLFGNVRYLEFDQPSMLQGREQNFEKGFLLDRPPKSIHGPLIDNITELGCLILEWGSGPLEFNYIPFEGNLSKYEETYNSPLVVNSKTTPWQEHPKIEGLKIKPLSIGGNNSTPGFHPVCLVYVPPNWNYPNNHSANGEKIRKWLYVIHGDLPLSIYGNENQLQKTEHLTENHYLEWFSPTNIVFCEKKCSETGSILLCVGHDLS